MASPAMKALFQCPAGNYMGLVVVHDGLTWSWKDILGRFETIDGEFLSFLQGAESITFFVGNVGMATIGGKTCTITLAPAKLTEARLGALVRTLNGLATSGIPLDSIKTSIKKDGVYSLVDPIIFMVTFGSGGRVAFRVGDVAVWGNNLRIAVGLDTHHGGWDSPIQMMPTQYLAESGGNFYRARTRCERFHTVYFDGTNNEFMDDGTTKNERGVRFDQWLVHHLLGESNDAEFMSKRVTDATYKARLRAACDIAGIPTDASGMPVQGLENDLNNILPWFLLYAAQAGNTEKTPSGTHLTFLGWLTAQGVTD
ncbi:MAG: hypothetical protein Q6370_012060, partial [Candidatus Sigynarchaeota archaeon]